MKKLVCIFLVLIFFSSCEETDLVDDSGQLTLSNINLPELDTSYKYEGWLLLNGYYISVGSFNYADFEINKEVPFINIDKTDLKQATGFAITAQPSSLVSAGSLIIMVGDFIDNKAVLAVDGITNTGIRALGYESTAAYTVQTPTGNSSQTTGVWFFKDQNGIKSSTLNLYFEEKMIYYQAWLKNGTDYLNMGKIAANTGRDDSNIYTSYLNLTDLPEFAGESFQKPPSGSSLPADYFPIDVRGKEIILTPVYSSYAVNKPLGVVLFQAIIPQDANGSTEVSFPLELNTKYSATATKL